MQSSTPPAGVRGNRGLALSVILHATRPARELTTNRRAISIKSRSAWRTE
jgi:hypothetical protein